MGHTSVKNVTFIFFHFIIVSHKTLELEGVFLNALSLFNAIGPPTCMEWFAWGFLLDLELFPPFSLGQPSQGPEENPPKHMYCWWPEYDLNKHFCYLCRWMAMVSSQQRTLLGKPNKSLHKQWDESKTCAYLVLFQSFSNPKLIFLYFFNHI